MRRPDEDLKRERGQGVDKRPYKKPRILSREKLEAMASDCNPMTGGKGDTTCIRAMS